METDAEVERQQRQQCLNIIGVHDFEDQSVQKRAQKRVSKEPIVIVDGEGLDEVVTEPNECKKKRKT